MATFTSIFHPATAIPTKVASLAGTSSSAELDFPNRRIIAIEATGDINVAFGNSGMAAASATGWLIPAGSTHQFDLGTEWSAIRVFNPGATAVDVYIMELSRV